MIKTRYFMPLFAALALTSCSQSGNDEPTNTPSGDYSYVAVNIIQSDATGTRANVEGEFEDGDPAENNAKEGLFFVLNGDNVTSAQRLNLKKDKDELQSGTNPNHEALYQAVLVIDGETTKPEKASIVCVLNAPAKLEEGVKNLNGIKGKLAYLEGHTADGTFIMSNSVYNDGTKDIIATPVGDNIANSASEALAKPVEICVERVVAKTRVTKGDKFDGTGNTGATVVIDGENKSLTIDVLGVEIANMATKAHLVKNIENISLPNINWNDVTNRRSYWETCPSDLAYTNKSFNDINDKDKGFPFSNLSTNKFTEYMLPNTSSQKTCVLVTAQLKDGSNAAEFVYLRGGYFKPENALNLIADYVARGNFYIQTSEDNAAQPTYKQFDGSDFAWRNNQDLAEDKRYDWLKDYEVVAYVKTGNLKIVKKNGDKYESASEDDVNTYLAGTDKHPYVARYYNQGMCYYYVDIDQSPVLTTGENNEKVDANTYPGVVRNHIYDLTLNSIGGLGTPVFDPEDVIIPQKPGTDPELWFLAAKVKVLAWRLVSQTVDFNGIK